MVILALDPDHGLTHEDIMYLWGVLNRHNQDGLNFHEWLEGMAFVAKDSRCKDYIDFAKPNKWELLSLIVDTPHSQGEEERILAGLSNLEKVGINMLKKMTMPMDKDHMKNVLTQVGEGNLRKVLPEQAAKMKTVHLQCVLVCAVTGFVFTAFPGIIENGLLSKYETDGMTDAYWVVNTYTGANGTEYDPLCRIDPVDESTCPANYEDWSTEEMCRVCGPCEVRMCIADPERLLWFHALNFSSIGFFVVFEIGLLMYFCAKYCVKVAWALDMRLVPLNTDRAFVADSLVRAAFELGNPDSPVLGVDPHAEVLSNFRKAVGLGLYKAKVILHSQLHKLLLTKTTSPSFYMYAKPWLGTCLCSILWDALVAHCIIHQAEVRALGVFTSVELFNEVLDHLCLKGNDVSRLTRLVKVQLVRAIGVAIVKNGSMYPSMELLLRHAIQYLGLRGSDAVSEPNVLDNEADFLKDMAKLTADQKSAALSIHLLAHLLNGTMSKRERQAFVVVCEAAGDEYEAFSDRMTFICWRYRNYELITAQDLRDCFDPKSTSPVDPMHKWNELWFNFTECLTC